MKILNKIMCVLGWITAISGLLIGLYIGILYCIALFLGITLILVGTGAKIASLVITIAIVAGIIALIVKLATGKKNKTQTTSSSFSESIYRF
ncbi:MAG: hypothetical protein LBM93_09505 [Oscillospiraceae bacterium]|jgi:hypothetical protein|nr:hypothetical protein [Oscillospiraceae bacterium]